MSKFLFLLEYKTIIIKYIEDKEGHSKNYDVIKMRDEGRRSGKEMP